MRRESTNTPDSITTVTGPAVRITTPAEETESPQQGSEENSGGRPPSAWLTAVHFDVPYPAEMAALKSIRTSLAITHPADDRVSAAAMMSWDRDGRRPRLQPLDIPGSLDHGLMELIFATTFLMPLIAAAMHSPPRPGSPPLNDIGIDQVFVNRLRDHLSPGTWMVLMLATPKQLDDIVTHPGGSAAPNQFGTLLTSAQTAALQTVFGTAPGE